MGVRRGVLALESAGWWDMGDQADADRDGWREDDAAIARMAGNVASIAAIPWEALCDGPARGCLLEMAYAGGDVSAVHTADGGWWVRLGQRWETCAAWAARFRL